MTTWIALLRAVNLGPHNKVAMAELRALLAELKYREPRTLLQSGNAVFAASGSRDGLEASLEKALASRFGFATDVMVRSADELKSVIARNPFPAEAKSDPAISS